MADQTSEARPVDPVSFNSPPVVQVILGVEFSGPVIDEVSVLADFWPQIREEFPEAIKQPPLAAMAENFDVTVGQVPFEFRMADGPQRYLFRNERKNLAVQIQENRFAFNWDRAEESETYPRYRWVRERFQEIYRAFTEVADDQLLERHPPVWCATTYTNQIPHPDSKDPLHGPLDDILLFVRRPDSEVLPRVEDTWIRQRRLLRDEDGEPNGRLYIEAVPTCSPPPEQIPGYQLTLRVVSRPPEPTEAGVFRCQDEGRELIVRSFKDITTPKMHELWGLED